MYAMPSPNHQDPATVTHYRTPRGDAAMQRQAITLSGQTLEEQPNHYPNANRSVWRNDRYQLVERHDGSAAVVYWQGKPWRIEHYASVQDAADAIAADVETR